MGFPWVAVTLLFTDVEGSTGLWEADSEAMAEASACHSRTIRQQIEGGGGQVFRTVGEAFRAMFADPSAVLASAVAIQRAVGAERWPPGSPLRVRIALHSGPALSATAIISVQWSTGPLVCWRPAVVARFWCRGGVRATGRLAAGRGRNGIWVKHRLQDLGRAGRVFEVTGPGRGVRRAALAGRTGAAP
jgi:Adenylate and Guanylate cyclase catalytic domain